MRSIGVLLGAVSGSVDYKVFDQPQCIVTSVHRKWPHAVPPVAMMTMSGFSARTSS